jgi:hypothetical protein
MAKIAAVMISVENKRIEYLVKKAIPIGTSGPLDRVRPAGQKSPDVIHTGLGLAFSKNRPRCR